VISQQGNSVFIDDINIGEFALSTSVLDNEIPWKIFPNPAKNNFIVETESKVINGNLSIMDLTGRILFEKKINSDKMTINSSGMPNGLYILSVVNDNKVWSSKLIINK
jgi:hypothetical protein